MVALALRIDATLAGKCLVLKAMGTGQSDTALDAMAKATMLTTLTNAANAKTLLTALLTAPSVRITNFAAFAAAAISAAPTSTTLAKTIADLVATKVAVASQVTFAGALAKLVPAGLAGSVAVGVAHANPRAYSSIVYAVACSSAANIAQSPAIAGSLAKAMQIDFANIIADSVARSVRYSASFATLAPQIAYQVSMAINAKLDAKNLRAQQIAAAAFSIIRYLNPASLASQAKVAAVITQVAKTLVGKDYANLVAGSLYTAIKAVQPNATYLTAISAAFRAGLPSSQWALVNAAFSTAAKNSKAYPTGAIPIDETPVVGL